MSTLKIINNFTIDTLGRTRTGKQGAAVNDFDAEHEVTVDGTMHEYIGPVATATVKKVWDKDTHLPTGFDYGYFWSDTACYLQLVSGATEVVIPVTALVPVAVPHSIVATAGTTDITGGSEPTVAVLDHINVGNYSGGSLNCQLSLIT